MMEQGTTDRVAIVGMGCRLPGAGSVQAFWDLLRRGTPALTRFSVDELVAAGIARRWLDHPDYVRAGMTLDDITTFDSEFFGIPAREADMMDPQQRLLLELAWETLESAAEAPRLGRRVGVYLGARFSEYMLFNQRPPDLFGSTHEPPLAGFQRLLVNDKDYLATRLSFLLDLRGPAMTVQTACSTSLVALHLACQALLNGECELALAGGASVRVPQRAGYLYQEGMVFSPDGHTRPFDAQAGGTVFGSGAGLVLLKRLDDALRDGNQIFAVVCGTAVNNDGSASKAGFTMPSLDGQVSVIAEALSVAAVGAESISYVEAHGTGTPLGDPIEVAALTEAFRAHTAATGYCALGSVKGNLGHLVQAAGVAGLIKTALMLKHREFVPSGNFAEPNPRIDFAQSPFVVSTTCRPWQQNGHPRRAGVSAFGFGGTNAHVILEEPPELPSRNGPRDGLRVLPVSAASGAALDAHVSQTAQWLATTPDLDVDDICHSAQSGRAHLASRCAVVGRDVTALAAALAARSRASGGRSERAVAAPVRVAFLYTGQGAQYANMGRRLYDTQPVFRETIEQCGVMLQGDLDIPLRDVLFGPDASGLLSETRYAQPGLMALQAGLTRLWESWGVVPQVVMGHSLGELPAAWAAGVMSLEGALHLAALRGRVMQSLHGQGRMVAALADPSAVGAVLDAIPGQVVIAAYNGPAQTIISGESSEVNAAIAALRGADIVVKEMASTYPFHSRLVEPLLGQIEPALRAVDLKAPRCEFVSTVSGAAATGTLTDVSYWRRQIREPVRFHEALGVVVESGCHVVIEIGPEPVLCALGRGGYPDHDAVWLPSLRSKHDALEQVVGSLARAYERGVDVRWDAVAGEHRSRARCVSFPPYPFQRKRHWIEPVRAGQPGFAPAETDASHPLLGTPVRSPNAEVQFQQWLSAESTPFLRDHWVYGERPQVGVSFLEMLWAALRSVAEPTNALVIDDFVVLQPLLHTEAASLLHTALDPAGDGTYVARVDSASASGSSDWIQHVSARISERSLAPEVASLPDIQSRCPASMDAAQVRETKRAHGADLGPAFSTVTSLRVGDGEVLARVTLTEEERQDLPRYLAHPGVIDACPHLAEHTLPSGQQEHKTDLFLPIAVDRAVLFAAVPSPAWLHLKRRGDAATDTYTVDARFFDDSGHVCALLHGVHFKRATPATLRRGNRTGGGAPLLHDVQWIPVEPPDTAARSVNGTWLLVGDAGSARDALAERIERDGGHVITRPLAPPATAASAASELQVCLRATPDLRGVVHVGLGDASNPDAGREHRALASLFHVTQALLEAPPSVQRLYVVTRGGQSTEMETGPPDPFQATMWGFGRTLLREQPTLATTLLDLDPAGDDEEADHLARCLARAGGAAQVAVRRGQWLTPRLRPVPAVRAPTAGPYRLEAGPTRTVEDLVATSLESRAIEPHEVEIEVWATGLGFRDLLNATGRLDGSLGFECSGAVVRCGAAVTHVQVGDTVMAVAYQALASHVIVNAHWVVRAPSNASFAESAALPLTYGTAVYGLEHCARLGSGERVLIHTAAGGVGLAAVAVARAAGAEVFATASRHKWSYLRALGVTSIMDSRQAGFATEIQRATNGRGVDVVLNTLGDDLMAENVEALAEGGRFVELGHPDLHDVPRLEALLHAKGARLHGFRLARDFGRADPEGFRAMLTGIGERVERGRLPKLPHHTWRLADVTRGLQAMSSGRLVGRVVVAHPAGGQRRAPDLRPDGTYLVTGGLGALGLQVAEWLAARGARHLVLVGRRRPSPAARVILDRLEASGVEVRPVEADVTDATAVNGMLAVVRDSPAPLAGIVHAAGTLDDAVVPAQSWERVLGVLHPKVDGAWNLHRATADLPIDFFVVFSSAAAVMGNPGQANYAAANAFLDQFVRYRRALGLTATSVAFGAWSGAGMGATLDEAVRQRRLSLGLSDLGADEALDALGLAIVQDQPYRMVLGVEWGRFVRQFGDGVPDVFRDLVPRGGSHAHGRGAQRDGPAVAPTTRVEIEAVVGAHVAELLGRSPADIDPHASLQDLGLDSLMILNLRGKLVQALGDAGALPVVRFLEGAAVARLADDIHAQTGAAAGETAPEPPATQPTAPIRESVPTWRSLTCIQPGGDRTPLFMVPPAGNTVAVYGELAGGLGADQPLFGFEQVGTDGRGTPFDSVEAMARLYIKEMREVWPAGPYRIGGACFGADVAYEMAQQLRGAGLAVDVLVLIDPTIPKGVAPGGGRRPKTLLGRARMRLENEPVGSVLVRRARRAWLDLRFHVLHPRPVLQRALRRRRFRTGNPQLYAACFRAQENYRHQPYSGRGALIESASRSGRDLQTWHRFAPGLAHKVFPGTSHVGLLALRMHAVGQYVRRILPD